MRVFCASRNRRFGWFRVFGCGLTWKDTRHYPLLFSERYGYTRRLQIGPHSFRLLGRR